MGIGLSIVFTGLCALVTDGGRGPGQVILVDTQGIGEVGGVTLPNHQPTLVVRLSSLSNAETSNPTRVITAWPGDGLSAASREFGGPVDQIGIWDLSGSEVRIRVQGEEPTGLQVFHPLDGTSSWPEPPLNANDPAAWRDVRFLADMKPLSGDGCIDPALVSSGDGSSGLPRSVAARVYLEGGLVEAGMPSQQTHRDDVFEFRSADHEPRMRQALTDTIRWSLETNGAPVIVEIVPVSGGPAKRLVLKPGETPHSLFVSNLPAENVPSALHHALSSEEMAALHFGVYYELLKDKPSDRPLPRPWVAPRSATGLMGRPLCPPAVFTRQ